MPPKGKIQTNQELQERLDAWENRSLKVKDLPLAQLKNELRKELNNPTELILPKSIGPELLKNSAGYTVTSSLPSDPDVGDTILFNAGGNTYWRLTYVGGELPWAYTGGAYSVSENAAEQFVESAGYVGAGGPTITVPLKGTYDVILGFRGFNFGAADSWMSYNIGATPAVDADACGQVGRPAGSSQRHFRLKRKTGLPANTLTCVYRTEGPNASFNSRLIGIRPVVVGL